MGPYGISIGGSSITSPRFHRFPDFQRFDSWFHVHISPRFHRFPDFQRFYRWLHVHISQRLYRWLPWKMSQRFDRWLFLHFISDRIAFVCMFVLEVFRFIYFMAAIF